MRSVAWKLGRTVVDSASEISDDSMGEIVKFAFPNTRMSKSDSNAERPKSSKIDGCTLVCLSSPLARAFVAELLSSSEILSRTVLLYYAHATLQPSVLAVSSSSSFIRHSRKQASISIQFMYFLTCVRLNLQETVSIKRSKSKSYTKPEEISRARS